MIFSTSSFDVRSLALMAAAISFCMMPSLVIAQENPLKDSREKILADQQRLSEQYDLLEKKLFSLYQYEKDQNPARSELLQKAYQTSKEKLTLEKFKSAVQQLSKSRFRNAEKSQSEISAELQAMLVLLQSEDRSKRVRDQIDLYKEYIKEINRILRIQQSIRGRSERGVSGQRLIDDQKNNADRTSELDKRLAKDEPRDQTKEKKPNAPPGSDKPNEPGDPNESPEPKQGGSGQGQPGDPDKQSQDGEPATEDQQPSGQAEQQGQSGGDQSAESENGESQNPVQQKLKTAEQKMREAQQKMNEAKGDESVEKMREAEKELQQAKRELERILRQLREEEIKRTLASLESRFRHMLALQIRIHDDTKMLDSSRKNSPIDDTEIQSGKLSVRENGLVSEAARALLVLEDDGSSIAVSEALRQAQQDMRQVAERLSAAKTDVTTQEIQQSVIETLGFLAEVFEQARSDDDQPQDAKGKQGQGQPGEQALIDQLAELKLIRGLQIQILNRHSRYSQRLDNPNDLVGHTSNPGIRQALEQLSQRQARLQQITHDIVVGKNR